MELLEYINSTSKLEVQKQLSQLVTITELLDGSNFSFQRTDEGFIFYKKDTKQPITIVDRTVSSYYEPAIYYINNLPEHIIESLPKDYIFQCQYFLTKTPNRVTYQTIPRNNLILTSIKEGNNYISDKSLLTNWANILKINHPPILFEGNLSISQCKMLIECANRNISVKNIMKILQIPRTTLNENLDNSVKGICFNFRNNYKTTSYKLIEKAYTEILESEYNKPNDTYAIAILDIINFIQSYDLSTIHLVESANDDRYLELMSHLFNEFLTENWQKYIDIDFRKPKFLSLENRMQTSFIKNETTLRNLNTKDTQEIFKIFINTLNKKKQFTTSLITESVLEQQNLLYDKITEVIEYRPNVKDTYANLTPKNEEQENVLPEYFDKIFQHTKPSIDPLGNTQINIVVDYFQPLNNDHIKVIDKLYELNKFPVYLISIHKTTHKNCPISRNTLEASLQSCVSSIPNVAGFKIIHSLDFEMLLNDMRPSFEIKSLAIGEDISKGMLSQIKYLRSIPHYNISDLRVIEYRRGIELDKPLQTIETGDQSSFIKFAPSALSTHFASFQSDLSSSKDKK